MLSPQATVDFVVGNEKFQTFYKIVGDLTASKSGRPLMVLHGGPGGIHTYMNSIADLWTQYNIPVIFYDQLGNGGSTHLKEKPADFWTPELFMDELTNLLEKLGIAGDFDLLGHSWGGMLGSQYAAMRKPKGLNKLIIASSPASMALFEETGKEYMKGVPSDVQMAFEKHESAGTTDSMEYKMAVGALYAKHVCRLQPMPKDVLDSFTEMDLDKTVNTAM